MAVQVSYPGVYIEEFAPGAPIQGVGTSTAAFIGVAPKGELDTPTKITSWDQFQNTFGDQPVPGFYLWYAVRGFFQNGGQVCYVVRASNGEYGDVILQDRTNSNDVIRVRARQPGQPVLPIQIQITGTQVIPATTTLFQPSGALSAIPSGRDLTLGQGEGTSFKPGDFITIATQGERIPILQVLGDTLRLESAPVNVYANGDLVRLADAPVGTRIIRIQPQPPAALPAGSLVPGTILTMDQGGNIDSQVVASVQTEPLGGGAYTYRVTFRQGLAIPLSLDTGDPATVNSEEFNFEVSQGGPSTIYSNLSIDPAHPRYFMRLINDADSLVQVELIEPPPPVAPPDNLPNDVTVNLNPGTPEDLQELANPAPPGGQHFIDALNTLQEIDDVNLIAIPDRITLPVQQALIAHCELMADRFAVLDSPPGLDLFGTDSIEEHRMGVDSTRGYAALYYPWLRVRSSGPGAPILVPPSGHVCGIIARSDNTRGVHKAPANEIVKDALGVETTMSDIDQGQLIGINVIRVRQNSGKPILWGAMTTATDLNWQYVNVRRLFLYMEESIKEGINWAVFEPNNLQLWQKLKRTITEFLLRVWRDGGLFGAKPEDAFFVQIDETLNPYSEQRLGRLNVMIGARPTYPAVYIIVQIGIWEGGSEISEL